MARWCWLAVVSLVACSAPKPGDDAGTPIDDAGTTLDAGSTIDAGPLPDQSPHGATLEDGGVTFRVWAPHATAVRVLGDFESATLTGDSVGVFSTHVAGVSAGARYRFSIDGPTGTVERIDPYCRQFDGSRCSIVDPSSYAWSTTTWTRPSRAKSVVYELHLGAFGNTFTQARAKLSELAELGVTVVALMPTQHFGGSTKGWGYNPQLWFAPKDGYGTPDELRAFVDEAHRLGLAVWLDLVVNHYDGWTGAPLYCFDGYCPQGTFGVHFFPPGQYATTPWGPRPDFSQPQVQKLIIGSAEQWLTEFRGDGIRWDSTSNIRGIDGQGTTPGGKELLQQGNARIRELGGLSVAEDLKGLAALTQSSAQGGFGFDAQWDGFGYDVTPVFTSPSDDGRDLGTVQRALTGAPNGDAFTRLMYLESHDTVGNGGKRLVDHIDATDPSSFYARKRALLAATLLMTTPGVPMIFMGQEQLASGTFTNPVVALPTPTVAQQKGRAYFRELIRLRTNAAEKAGGLQDTGVEVFHRNDPAKVIAYRRHGSSGEEVVVVLNLANKAYARYDIGVGDAGPWRVRLDSDQTAYGDDFGGGQTGPITAVAGNKDGKPYTLPLKLGAYSAVVLTR